MATDELLHHQCTTDGDTAAKCGVRKNPLTLTTFGQPFGVALSPPVPDLYNIYICTVFHIPAIQPVRIRGIRPYPQCLAFN
jgi:hypothetical protein